MTIEQHAEAAADEIDRSMTDGPNAIISKHMQSAVDEALAEKMIGVLDNASNHVHEIDLLRARIAELEGLGPLIEEYIAEVNRLFYLEDQSGKMLDLSLKITAILKGGGS